MFAFLLCAGSTFRRMLRLPHLLVSAAAGLLVGLVVLGLPLPRELPHIYTTLVSALLLVVTVPMVAGLPTRDRVRGYEALTATRPLASATWALGRVLGTLVGAAGLVVVLLLVARSVSGLRQVPLEVSGSPDEVAARSSTWRFAVPKGAEGPFVLALEGQLLAAGPRELALDVRRGSGRHRERAEIDSERPVHLSIPDLHPQRGDLYLTLRPDRGLVLGEAPPHLTVGTRPLDPSELQPSKGAMAHLVLAVLATACAACAFPFATACLAGLFAFAVRVPETGMLQWSLVAALLLLAILGTAMTRHQAVA